MKRLLVGVMFGLLLVSLAACGGGNSAVPAYNDFEAFVPFIPGYFPDDFEILQVGHISEHASDEDIYTEYYTSVDTYFELIQSQGRAAPVTILDTSLTIQGQPASLAEVPDPAALVKGDLDLVAYADSSTWLLTVVLKDITVQIISNLPQDEVIALGENLVPAFCTSTPTPEG